MNLGKFSERFSIPWQESVFSQGSPEFVDPYCFSLGDPVTISIRIFDDAPVESVYLWTRPDNKERVERMSILSREGRFRRYGHTIRVEQNRLHYYFVIAGKDRVYYYNQLGLQRIPPPSVYDFILLSDFQRPDWCDETVFYQIFPDRFCNGDSSNDVGNSEYSYGGFESKKRQWHEKPLEWEEGGCLDFFGGDLKGIEDKLGYLDELGVNALYLNPIFHAPSHHKFDCIDYERVDPHLGDNQGLSSLTKACHDRDMKIILDISINHTGTAHRWFNREEWFGKNRGAYFDPDGFEGSLYLRREGESDEVDGLEDPFLRWLGVDSLVTLDYSKEDTRKLIYENEDSILKKWLKEPYSIDGWRFDVAFMMARYKSQNYQKEVWPAIRKDCKGINSKVYLVTEDWTDASEFLQGDIFDATMNYFALARPLRRWCGLMDRCLEGKEPQDRAHKDSALDLASALEGNLARIPHVLWGLQLNLIGSHDWFRLHNAESVDFSTYQGVLSVQFTFPGVPCIYYGDEVGIEGHCDSVEGCRYPMPWREDRWDEQQRGLYKSLAHLRRKHRALHNGSYRRLHAFERVYSFARFSAQEILFTVISDEREARRIRLPIALANAEDGSVFRDYLGKGEDLKVEDGFVELEIVPGQSSIYLAKDWRP